MFYFDDHRFHAKTIFQQIINLKIDKNDNFKITNVLFDKNKETKIEFSLTKTIIIILCEFIFDVSLKYQMFKRVYKYEQKNKMMFYTIIVNIMIEKIMNKKRKKNAMFTNKMLQNI